MEGIGANVVLAPHVVCARGDVVATKLGIILSSFSFHAHTSKSEGGQRTGAKQRDTALR